MKKELHELMIVRIFVAVFSSLVGGLSYLTGLAKLMTAFLLGFGAVCSFLLGVLFVLPVNANRLFFPDLRKGSSLAVFFGWGRSCRDDSSALSA